MKLSNVDAGPRKTQLSHPLCQQIMRKFMVARTRDIIVEPSTFLVKALELHGYFIAGSENDEFIHLLAIAIAGVDDEHKNALD